MVSDQVKRLELKSPLILSTPQQVGQAETIQKIVSSASIIPAGIYAKATMHTPSHITEDAVSFAKTENADCVIQSAEDQPLV